MDNHKAALVERGELHSLKKKCEERIKELDVELRPVLEGRGEIVYSGFAFKVSPRAGSKTLDKKSVAKVLAAHGYDIADFETEGAPTTVFTVKEVSSI